MLIRLKFNYFLLLVLAFFSMASCADSAQGLANKQIKIYFIDWDIVTRRSLSSEDIKRMRHIYIELNESVSVSNILKAIKKLDCVNNEGTHKADFRLVIDVFENEKIIDTYITNKEYVYIGDSKICKINEMFFDSLNVLIASSISGGNNNAGILDPDELKWHPWG